MADTRKALHQYIAPRYWPTWLGLGLLRVVCWLPHGGLLAVGRLLGRITFHFSGTRGAIVRRNLRLCFPDMPDDEREALAREHFEALGISLMETGLGRWASDEHLAGLTTIEGVEHVLDAVNAGKGVILLSAHFTTLELSGRVLRLHIPPFDAVYRKNRSKFITEVLRTGRERSAARTIEKNDIKAMVRSLRQARVVWYAPDQSYRRKGAEVIPFFGVPSMHTTATSTLARLGKAVTIPYFRSGSRTAVTSCAYWNRFRTFPAMTWSPTPNNMSACWKSISVVARSNTSGYTGSSRACPNRILTTTRTWPPRSSLPGSAPSRPARK